MKKFFPKWLALEITSRCNLNCIHCRSSSEMHSKFPEMTFFQIKKLIDDISSFAKPVIVLTGGEPLLHKNVFDIASYGSSKGLRMGLATNGTLITDKICNKIKQSGIQIVAISLDGSTPEIHDNFRKQPGAFAGTMKAMKHFRKNNIPFIINSSFTQRNQNDIENVYHFARKTGAIAWYMFLVVPTGRARELFDELITPKDYQKILKWHYKVEKEETEILMRPTCAPDYYRVFHQMSKKDGTSHSRRSLTFSTGGNKGCVCAQSIALIRSNGDILPCSYFNAKAGNVLETPFKEIWEKADLFLSLRDFDNYKDKCPKCEYLNVCGGCRARAEAYYGDYLREDPYCDYIPLSLRKK